MSSDEYNIILREPLVNEAVIIKREFLESKSSFRKSNTNYKLIARELLDMGFELEMIDMCFCFFNIENITDAVNYMTKDEGVWQHKYIEDENKCCIVCKQNEGHIDYIVEGKGHDIREHRESLNIKAGSIPSSLDRQKNTILDVEGDPEYIKGEACLICQEDKLSEEFYSIDVKHTFCASCWKSYVEEKIYSNDVINSIK